jgi:hypothetical protein
MSVPAPHEAMKHSDKPTRSPNSDSNAPAEPAPSLDPMYKVLPPAEQKLQLWAHRRCQKSKMLKTVSASGPESISRNG